MEKEIMNRIKDIDFEVLKLQLVISHLIKINSIQAPSLEEMENMDKKALEKIREKYPDMSHSIHRAK